jgi:hypothetical protein
MKELSLTKGKVALVDDDDYSHLATIKWFSMKHKMNNGESFYALASLPGIGKNVRQRRVKLHRYILGINDPKVQVDHKNGDTLDCRKMNLRIATHAQNQQNKKKSPGKQSQFKGVRRSISKRNPWRAYIKPNSKLINLGQFPTEREAAIAYNVAAVNFYGEYARLNQV